MTKKQKNNIEIWRMESKESDDIKHISNRARKKKMIEAVDFMADRLLPAIENDDHDASEKISFEFVIKFVIDTKKLTIDILAMHLLSSIIGLGFAFMLSDDGIRHRFICQEEFGEKDPFVRARDGIIRYYENDQQKIQTKDGVISLPKGNFYAPGSEGKS